MQLREPDQLKRIAQAMTRCTEFFGSEDKAAAWLMRHNRVLGMAPVHLAAQAGGMVEIEAELSRIEHGVVV